MATTESEVKKMIGKILEDKKSYNTSLNYAVNYCQAATWMTGKELAVQCLYILNNISHWRHPLAKQVRQTLKDFSKNG